MWPKNNAATKSAAERHELGWPLPAAVVASMESIRNWFAIPDKVSSVFVFIRSRNCMARELKSEGEKN
jgi:hypothetical protein